MLEWLQGTTVNTAPSTYKRYQQVIHSFLAHLGVKADRLLREVTSKDVRSWRDALRAKGLSAPTVNQAVKTLRIPFRVASDNGIIDINPNTKSSLRLLPDGTRIPTTFEEAQKVFANFPVAETPEEVAKSDDDELGQR